MGGISEDIGDIFLFVYVFESVSEQSERYFYEMKFLKLNSISEMKFYF